MLSKIFATFYPQILIATSFYLQAGPAYQVHVDQSVKPESPTLPLPRCWRIEGIPEKWSKDELIESLQTLDESLKELESDRLSLYPACWGKFKTGLLRPKLSLKFFDDLKTDDTNIITIYTRDAKSGEIIEVDLSIDCLFYGLTPLNDPKGKIIIDVVAVTGLAGHAFESWRNRRSSPRMWLQDFLPLDIEENIRILTYGYNSSLRNEGQRRILDYRRNFVQSLTNARKDVPLRPIVFVGHSLGCTVITQALLQSRDSLRDQYILRSTRSVIFFGAPHQGLNVDSLMAMVENMSEGKQSTRLQLLRQLQEDSEFMEDQKERLVHIWKNLKIISFYETEHTSTVRRSAAGKWERGGEAIQMVKETSSQLYLPQEERYPIWGNHSSIAKFTKRTDESYTTVVNHIEQCVENEKMGEEAIGRWIVSHGKRL